MTEYTVSDLCEGLGVRIKNFKSCANKKQLHLLLLTKNFTQVSSGHTTPKSD